MNMIKSIRIIQRKMPNPQPKPSPNPNKDELFSFSKRQALRERPIITPQVIAGQLQSIDNLQRMIKRMLFKCKKQQEKMENEEGELERLQQCTQKNRKLKQQLLGLKEFMKKLLLERQELKVLDFYQQ